MEVADTAALIDARTPESEMAENDVPDSSIDVRMPLTASVNVNIHNRC